MSDSSTLQHQTKSLTLNYHIRQQLFADDYWKKDFKAILTCWALTNVTIVPYRTKPCGQRTLAGSAPATVGPRIHVHLHLSSLKTTWQQAELFWWRRQTQLACLFVLLARNIHVKLNYPQRTDHFPLLTHALIARSLFTQVRQAAQGDYEAHVGKKIFATWQETHFLGTQRPFYFLYGKSRV